MNVIAMSNGKVESQGTDSSVESTAVQINSSDKMDQILSIVSDIQVDLTGVKPDVRGLKSDVRGLKSDVKELKSDMTKVKTILTSIEGSVEAIGSQLDEFRD